MQMLNHSCMHGLLNSFKTWTERLLNRLQMLIQKELPFEYHFPMLIIHSFKQWNPFYIWMYEHAYFQMINSVNRKITLVKTYSVYNL